MKSNDSRIVPDATKDKSKTTNKDGNNTVTDVPADELKKDAQRQKKDMEGNKIEGDTTAGKAKKPASSNSPDVAPITKQNQDTDTPSISVVPPVYGHKGIKDITKAKTDWEVAEAKLEARYGLPFLDTKTKEERKQLMEDEYRRLHNGSLTEDMMTSHHNNEPQEYVGNMRPKTA